MRAGDAHHERRRAAAQWSQPRPRRTASTASTAATEVLMMKTSEAPSKEELEAMRRKMAEQARKVDEAKSGDSLRRG